MVGKMLDSLTIQTKILKALKLYGELSYKEIAQKIGAQNEEEILVFDECDWLSEDEINLIFQSGFKFINGKPVNKFKLTPKGRTL